MNSPGKANAPSRRANAGEGQARRNEQNDSSGTGTIAIISHDGHTPVVTVRDLATLATLHTRAWRGFERFCEGLAERGIAWHTVDGADAVFSRLDAACELADRMRADLAEAERLVA